MSNWREEVAEVLQAVARDGLPEPRDLDVALDAIECSIMPAGTVLVPREPTEAMVKSAIGCWTGESEVEYIWENMIETTEKEKKDEC